MYYETSKVQNVKNSLFFKLRLTIDVLAYRRISLTQLVVYFVK